MPTPVEPPELPAPGARYAHAMLVESPSRWLHTSGIVPVARDGSVPGTVTGQAAAIWHTLSALLDEAGMTADDVVSITTYVVASAGRDGLGEAMAERDAFFGGRRVASTLVTVPALADPRWLIEIALVAAR